jgi:hypothetical protein
MYTGSQDDKNQKLVYLSVFATLHPTQRGHPKGPVLHQMPQKFKPSELMSSFPTDMQAGVRHLFVRFSSLICAGCDTDQMRPSLAGLFDLNEVLVM